MENAGALSDPSNLTFKKVLEKVQEEYQKLQESYLALCEVIPDMYLFVNDHLDIIDCNLPFACAMGYQQDELKGKSFLPFLSEESRSFLKDSLPHLFSKKNNPAEHKLQLIRRDAKILEVKVDLEPIHETAKTGIKIKLCFCDLSLAKRLKSELENKQYLLDTILKTVKEGILIIDSDYKIQFMNDYFKKILGDNQIGKFCYEVLQGEKARCEGEDCAVYQIVEKNRPYLNLSKKDAKGNVCDISSYPFPHTDNTRSVLLVSRDITEKKKLQDELRECKATFLKEIQARYKFENIIGKSEKMQEIYDLVTSVAQTRCTVLIQGESGTGKELIARAIHYNSPEKNHPFVAISCSVFSENLLESELFGHVKGAFTGAIRDRSGRFEMADGGTVFLDEIGDINLSVQSKLLRVLQEREFERVGGDRTIKVNLRVVAATNKNLENEIREGRFREDLYYRLAVIPIIVPPLRERKVDIPLLIEHFIAKYRKIFKKKIKGISPEAMAALLHYHWPGNVRELEGVLEYVFIKGNGDVITADDLPKKIREGGGKPEEGRTRINLRDSRIELSRETILAALQEVNGNREKAAKLLHISRTKLWKLMKQHNF